MKKKFYLITTDSSQELFFGTAKKAFKRSAAIGGQSVRCIKNKAELRELQAELLTA